MEDIRLPSDKKLGDYLDKNMEKPEPKINENIIKITGSACIEQPIEYGHDYKLAIETQCFSVEERDKQDGTIDRVHKLRMLGEVYINDKGKALIKGTSKKQPSPSQRLYNALYVVWSSRYTGSDEDYQIWYESKMNEITEKVKGKIV